MSLVAGVDVGGSSVKAWLATTAGQLVRAVSAPLVTSRPAPHRAEFDPSAWWAASATALRDAVGDRGGRVDGLVVCSLRQGFVLLGAGGGELGPGVLNSDRRGASHLGAVGGNYRLTGHWPAPELTLPKLLHLREREPQRWAATARVLFVHDWLVRRLTGVEVTEASYACAGGMADVASRGWATDLLAFLGIETARLAPIVEAGTVVGRLADTSLGLPAGLPVHAGCGDTQVAALGAGGLADGVVTVVAGSSTPVQAAVAAAPVDPREHPWVSTHARSDRWAVETNAGYPGTYAGWLAALLPHAAPSGTPGAAGLTAVTGSPLWSEAMWAVKPPVTLLGLRPDTSPGDLAQAVAEGHGYAVRGNLEDLERVLGAPARSVVVAGGGAAALAPLLAQVLGREVTLAEGDEAARGGVALVTGTLPPDPDRSVLPAGDPAPYAEGYARFRRAHAVLQAQLPDVEAS